MSKDYLRQTSYIVMTIKLMCSIKWGLTHHALQNQTPQLLIWQLIKSAMTHEHVISTKTPSSQKKKKKKNHTKLSYWSEYFMLCLLVGATDDPGNGVKKKKIWNWNKLSSKQNPLEINTDLTVSSVVGDRILQSDFLLCIWLPVLRSSSDVRRGS